MGWRDATIGQVVWALIIKMDPVHKNLCLSTIQLILGENIVVGSKQSLQFPLPHFRDFTSINVNVPQTMILQQLCRIKKLVSYEGIRIRNITMSCAQTLHDSEIFHG